MLRAALIGFASSGRSTLFELMTSVHESARGPHGRNEPVIGMSRVPDARLDRLTAMYNPRKRVPATVEFSDLAAPAGKGGSSRMRLCRIRPAPSTRRATLRRWRTS
jgi:ribosome-binding ATPase YchF (GTP1/OBG family)